MRWLEWIRAAGQLDRDVQLTFSSQLFDLAMQCMSVRQVDLAREILQSLRRLNLAITRSRRAQPMYLFVANLPGWCSPVLMRGLQQGLELKDLASRRLALAAEARRQARSSVISLWPRHLDPTTGAAVGSAMRRCADAVRAVELARQMIL